MSYDLKAEIDRINSVISNGKYKDTDESLSQYEVPSWYKKAKFGIFIHWGVYSQAAFANEWYPRNMYLKDTPEYKHHIETMGPHTEKGYKDYIPLFKGEKFDPEAWINLIKKSGAKYMVPVAEHHDGFQMYKSKLSHWNAFEMGPKRDTTFELEQAARQAGIHFGTSSHRIEHWWFLGDGRNFDSDIKGEFERGDLYWPSNYMYYTSQFDIFAKPEPSTEFMEDWLARTCEIVDRFHPEVLYFDWWIEHAAMRPYVNRFWLHFAVRPQTLPNRCKVTVIE
ncbi:MAG: alpha-L-fucosidase, partial [Catonella sp.]|nr:alpha-L-fucosidase [Catonella sp.]